MQTAERGGLKKSATRESCKGEEKKKGERGGYLFPECPVESRPPGDGDERLYPAETCLSVRLAAPDPPAEH